jgi:hypothetical protein
MEPLDYIDLDEGRNTPFAHRCTDCGAKSSHGVWLTEYTLPENVNLLLCDDCITEQKKVETAADELAVLPSCEARQRIVERPNKTVQQLVNALLAHDLGCAECASTRKAAQEDRTSVTPAAVKSDGRVA